MVSQLLVPKFNLECSSHNRKSGWYIRKQKNYIKLICPAGARLLELHTLMAKWGEGDPRWIVEEREDAKNVNNWHW